MSASIKAKVYKKCNPFASAKESHEFTIYDIRFTRARVRRGYDGARQYRGLATPSSSI